MDRTTVDQLLAGARARLHRLFPEEAAEAARAGALLIDIRSEGQRDRDGVITGARFIARNVFEWRCDPSSASCDPEVVRRPAHRLIVICDEGYQSSLAAATLQRFGFTDATDVIGGFRAWRAAGLNVRQRPGQRVSESDGLGADREASTDSVSPSPTTQRMSSCSRSRPADLTKL